MIRIDILPAIRQEQNAPNITWLKNSCECYRNPYKGYLYASETYVRYKTVSIMVHKNAIPKDIAKKLGL